MDTTSIGAMHRMGMVVHLKFEDIIAWGKNTVVY